MYCCEREFGMLDLMAVDSNAMFFTVGVCRC